MFFHKINILDFIGPLSTQIYWGKMHENFQIIVETSSWSQIKDNFMLKNNV